MESRKRNTIVVPEWYGTVPFLLSLAYFVLVASLTLGVSSRKMSPTGDEPHYLMVAHSLAVDGDLSLANNYLEKQYRIFYKGELAKRTSPSGDRTRELPAQGLGLSFLLAPFYKLILVIFPPVLLPALRLLMCSITTIVLYQLIHLSVTCGIKERASYFVMIGAAAASPILTYSSLFYPEMPACLLIIIGLRHLLEMEEHRWRSFFWLAFIPGALLWLHPKYLALSIGILIAAAIYFYYTFRFYDRTPGILPFVYTVISGLWILTFFLFLHDQYGGWSPNLIYAGWDKAPQSLMDLLFQEGIRRIGTMIRIALGLWIDQRFGLITHAPLYLLFFAGAIYLFHKIKRQRFILFLFIVHFLVLCWGAPLGGYAPPSRHMIVLLPMCLIAIAHIFSKYSGVKKFVSILLFALSWIIAALMFYDFRSLFTNLTWRNPDGFSPFWQRFKIEVFIPLLTTSQPKILLLLIWCIILICISFLLYPRQKKELMEL